MGAAKDIAPNFLKVTLNIAHFCCFCFLDKNVPKNAISDY